MSQAELITTMCIAIIAITVTTSILVLLHLAFEDSVWPRRRVPVVLPACGSTTRCPKCDHAWNVQPPRYYHNADCDCEPVRIAGEHLRMKCHFCGYAWAERVARAGE